MSACTPLRYRNLVRALALALGLLAAGWPGPGLPVARAQGTPQALRFVVLGDTGTGTPAQYRVAGAVAQHCRRHGCDLALLLGDNFYPSGVRSASDPLWRERFEKPYGALDIPFYVALGNHDYGRNDKALDFGRAEAQVAYGRTHPHWVLPAPYYAFRRGPVTFIALDTTALLVQHDDAARRQGAMVERALREARTPWVVVFGHHPYVSNGPGGSAGAYWRIDRPDLDGAPIKRFFERHLCGRVQLYFAGHEHNRQMLPGPARCPGLFVIAGSGALVKGFRDLAGTVRAVPTYFKSASLGFAYVRARPDRMVVQLLDARGHVDAVRELRRPGP